MLAIGSPHSNHFRPFECVPSVFFYDSRQLSRQNDDMESHLPDELAWLGELLESLQLLFELGGVRSRFRFLLAFQLLELIVQEHLP